MLCYTKRRWRYVAEAGKLEQSQEEEVKVDEGQDLHLLPKNGEEEKEENYCNLKRT
jgi:hypothetical protein